MLDVAPQISWSTTIPVRVWPSGTHAVSGTPLGPVCVSARGGSPDELTASSNRACAATVLGRRGELALAVVPY